MKQDASNGRSETGKAWDHSSHDEFYEYYAQASQSEETLVRFRSLRDTLAGIARIEGASEPLDVADIGGGAGTLAMVWAEQGHRVRCLDINKPLIELAQERASKIELRPPFFGPRVFSSSARQTLSAPGSPSSIFPFTAGIRGF